MAYTEDYDEWMDKTRKSFNLKKPQPGPPPIRKPPAPTLVRDKKKK